MELPLMMQVNWSLDTAGDGYWSRMRTSVLATQITLIPGDDRIYGHIQVHFDPTTWNTEKWGLIYTDSMWLLHLRVKLVELGFTSHAANDLDYSEQGMQGDDYVDLYVGELFMSEAASLGLSEKMEQDWW